MTAYASRIIAPYKPRLVVLGAGTNDLHAGKSPDQVAEDFKAFVAKVRELLPDVRIAVYSLHPAPSRAEEIGKVRRTNQLIKESIAYGRNLDYIDIFDALMGPDGQPREDLFVADRLHPNAAGYDIRTELTRVHLGPAMKAK